MHAQELSSLIAKGDLQVCIDFFKGFTEAQRKGLSKPAIQEFERIVADPFIPKPQISCAFLVLLATCNLTQIKNELDAYLPKGLQSRALDTKPPVVMLKDTPVKVLTYADWLNKLTDNSTRQAPVAARSDFQSMTSILKERRPDWLNSLVDYLLRQAPGRFWPFVRLLEREALIETQDSEQYYVGMVQLVSAHPPDYVFNFMQLDQILLKDRLWDLFACQHSSVRDRFHAHAWFPILLHLVDAGLLDRVKVIDAMIKLWLSRKERGRFATSPDFMSNLYEKFNPTEKEEIALLPVYISMLSNPRVDIIKFAQDKLKDKIKHVDPHEFIKQAANAFSVKGKEIPLRSMKLLREIVRNDPGSRKESVNCLLQALDHDSSDVRSKAFDLIEEFTDKDQDIHNEVSTILRAKVGELGSLKSRVETWLQVSDSESQCEKKSKASVKAIAKVSAPKHENVEAFSRSRLSEPDQHFQNTCHFAELLDIVEGKCDLILALGLDLRDQKIPRLFPENAIQPIDNLDDLIYALLQVLHSKASGDDLERVVDGMARLFNERPQELAQRTDALKGQAQRQLAFREGDSPWDRTPLIGNDYRSDVAALILSWLDYEEFQSCFASLLTPSLKEPGLSAESLEAACSTTEAFNKTWRGPYTSRVSLVLYIIAKITDQLKEGGANADIFQLSLKRYTDLVSEVRTFPCVVFFLPCL